jgi:hypothetical protein
MKRMILLGLALLAIGSATAVAASTSDAAVEFHTAKAPATISGELQSGNAVLVTEAGTITCAKDQIGGAMSALSQASVTTNSVAYKECTAKTLFGNIPATVDFATNGCSFTFHALGVFDLLCKTFPTPTILAARFR